MNSQTHSNSQHSNDIVAFAQQELNANILERDKNQVFGKEEWLKCGDAKLHGTSISESYGGLGLNALQTAETLEALGYGCEDGGLIFSLSAQLLACTIPIFIHGSEEQKKKYLPLLASGKIIAANAITEKKSGSNIFSMQTAANKSSSGFRINGQKSYISNAPNADIILLYAATDLDKGFHGGISAFIIDDTKKSGIHISEPIDKMGLRTCMMGNVEFENVEISESQILGKIGAGAMIFSESMNWERILLSAVHVGTMKRILEKSVSYINKRSIDNDTIAKYQTNSHKVAEMHTLIETSRLLVHKASSELDNKVASVSLTASTTKLYVSEALNKVCDLALLIFAANGYTSESSIERYKRDAVAALTYSGTNDIQKNIIAKWLGV